ncbi:hypothetical protein [Neobacillus thermocopriae]|uniref:NAD(P)-dependent oxidoreductase n=1 Tax=Neobacillus thermocopriae TaxID=1215031 RepID=A0A6B3TPW4_9BACI|nr:hypothetical protein [Neobacillus thermocopriae]MED3623104.1 hypothetical protein [Neobacillus thermocopriae]MED3714999.1 hypothetical protein [Neobacillus thermocopriae]NEX78853.1 hypothetical protein [Neobacillus thermocopriae]
MDKAIIIGVYHFLGFHIGKVLLNKGIEVKGVHIPEVDGTYVDEKRLEVGRNANFKEYSFEGILDGTDNDRLMIFPIYDFFMLQQESIILNEQFTKKFLAYFNKHKCNLKILLLLPIQLLKWSGSNEIQYFINQVKKISTKLQLIYLPTIYGPWQPSTFMFQQVILASILNTEVFHSEREWMDDALFIDDVAESILGIIESEKSGTYLLESGKDMYWDTCAEYLKINKRYRKSINEEKLQIDGEIKRIIPTKITSISSSLSKQMEHTKWLYQNLSSDRY